MVINGYLFLLHHVTNLTLCIIWVWIDIDGNYNFSAQKLKMNSHFNVTYVHYVTNSLCGLL